MSPEVQAWRENGKHLPAILKDFHAQKEVFQTMHMMLGAAGADDVIKRPSTVEGQCYVIDCFLWFMARHGYTLQRSRAQLEFDDLAEHVKFFKQRLAELTLDGAKRKD